MKPKLKSPSFRARWEAPPPNRHIVVIEATLVLESPLSIASGDADATGDCPILRTPGGDPFIPGTSLAGALRGELAERLSVDGRAASTSTQALSELFGGEFGDEEGSQARLFIDDLRCLDPEASTELRDHVAMDGSSGVAQKGRKYDREIVSPGTRFALRLEWHVLTPPIQAPERERDLLLLTLAVLEGIQTPRGGVECILSLGGRTRRGYGKVRIQGKAQGGWSWRTYDIGTATGLRRWILEGAEAGQPSGLISTDVARGLDRPVPALNSSEAVRIELELKVVHSLIVRGPGRGSPRIRQGEKTMGAAEEKTADASHLRRARTGGEPEAIVPATAFAGALRHRAQAIENTVIESKGVGRRHQLEPLVWELFGPPPDRKREAQEDTARGVGTRAGGIRLEEAVVRGGRELRHTRVSIDPWTGGALDSFLFTEDAVYGGRLKLEMQVRRRGRGQGPHDAARFDAALGLLVLTLRDLWEGDLPIGGEVSIGRGVLKGVEGLVKAAGREEPLQFDVEGRLTGGGAMFGGWVEKMVNYLDGEVSP